MLSTQSWESTKKKVPKKKVIIVVHLFIRIGQYKTKGPVRYLPYSNTIIMTNLRILKIILIGLLFINDSSLFAQKLDPQNRVVEPDAIVSSRIMDKDYQLYISFPNGYSAKDTIKYPVFYVLDGLPSFPLFNSIRKLLDLGKEIEKIIIVGIGCGLDLPSWYINRVYDYTPSDDTVNNRNEEKIFGFPKGTILSGGAAKFLECIKTEIIPFVDKHYHTTTDRGIYGHSLGGLFASYCLLNSTGIFTRYGITSPSLQWNDREILNQESSAFSKIKSWDLPTKIFISVGGLEGSKMIQLTTEFSSTIQSKSFKDIYLILKIFENETHLSSKPASLTRTISVLYKK